MFDQTREKNSLQPNWAERRKIKNRLIDNTDFARFNLWPSKFPVVFLSSCRLFRLEVIWFDFGRKQKSFWALINFLCRLFFLFVLVFASGLAEREMDHFFSDIFIKQADDDEHQTPATFMNYLWDFCILETDENLSPH